MSKLYAKDSSGKIRFWEAIKSPNGFDMHSGLIGGKVTVNSVRVLQGKAGRTWEEQINLEIQSRIKNKIDSGFTDTIAEATTKNRTNALGLIRPMLAKTGVSTYDKHSFVQAKYDGLRTLITCRSGKNIAYSRTGQLYPALSHIVDRMIIPEGETIDGEIYCHNTALQDINSWTRRKQDNTIKLKYICYDIVNDFKYKTRLELIQEMKLGPSTLIAPTYKLNDIDLDEMFKKVRLHGYEGLIIRQPDFGYQIGKRNSALIKIKEFYDDTFNIRFVSKSKAGYGIFHMYTEYGDEFKVVCPGTHEEKVFCADNPDVYNGKNVEIKYADLSSKGIPTQPVALRILND